jgi:6-phosphogluconate dehydrogenase (decarboxylating)
MHIGLIGLGKMGFNMRERLRKGGIEVTGFDRNPDITDVAGLDELIAAVPAPRWPKRTSVSLTAVYPAGFGACKTATD